MAAVGFDDEMNVSPRVETRAKPDDKGSVSKPSTEVLLRKNGINNDVRPQKLSDDSPRIDKYRNLAF